MYLFFLLTNITYGMKLATINKQEGEEPVESAFFKFLDTNSMDIIRNCPVALLAHQELESSVAVSHIPLSLMSVACETTNEEILCPVCNKKFLSKSAATRHHQTAHLYPTVYICDYPDCYKYFTHKASLTAHNKNKHEKKTTCTLCKRKYSMACYLNLCTEFNANNEKQCSSCNKKFATKMELKKHYARKHNPTDRFACTSIDCTKSYSTKASLSLHYTRNHTKKRFNCDMCDAEFSLECDLNQHLKRSMHKNP